jgi:hypothetical protein
VAHFEWPDIGTSKALKMVVFFRHRTSDYTIGGVAGAKPYGGYSGRIFSCYGQLQSLLDDGANWRFAAVDSALVLRFCFCPRMFAGAPGKDQNANDHEGADGCR